jgi:hypothetical protein
MPTSASLVLAAALVGLLQAVPEELLTQVTSLGPVEAGLIGGGGVVSVGAVRWLVKRRAAGAGSQAATATAVSTTAAGGKKHSVAFTLPGLLPVSKGIRQVTHNEVHAIELGFLVGLVLAWLYDAGHTKPVIGILVAFVAGSLGYRRYSSKAVETIRVEPWYALLALAAGGALGWALFVAEPGLPTRLGI